MTCSGLCYFTNEVNVTDEDINIDVTSLQCLLSDVRKQWFPEAFRNIDFFLSSIFCQRLIDFDVAESLLTFSSKSRPHSLCHTHKLSCKFPVGLGEVAWICCMESCEESLQVRGTQPCIQHFWTTFVVLGTVQLVKTTICFGSLSSLCV